MGMSLSKLGEEYGEGTVCSLPNLLLFFVSVYALAHAVEIWATGHSRLLEMVPFSRSHTISYSSSIVTGHRPRLLCRLRCRP